MGRVYIIEDYCIGCRLCEVYCRLQHARSNDLIKVYRREPNSLPRVHLEEKEPLSISVRCQHCEEAPCVSACLTGALQRDAVKGSVLVDEEKCMGCWTCVLVCPVGAIKIDKQRRKTVKCDLCQGIEMPACVANCPNEALVYSPNGR